VQIADGGRLLLAVDAGSNQVSVLRIQPDGSLRLASVVSSVGVLPVSIAVHGTLVYVANASPADSDYTGFRVTPWGSLTPVPGSTVSLPAAAQPGDVLFNGTGTKLVGTRVGTSQIDSSPVADQQTAPCWVTISPDGRYLFAVNTGSGTISRYSIAPGGALTLLGSTQVSANGGVGAVDPGLSPDGRFLYVNESKISSVGAFAVSGGGNLTELPGSPTPLPAGATPAGIAVS
jgi:6-phosphogluconolactonase